MGSLSRLAGRKLLVIGRVGMDLYADPPGARTEEATRFTSALGGSAANTAVALVRQGCAAALVTCVSDDAIGRYCLNQLDSYGIDRRYVRAVTSEARTSLALVETRLENCQSVIYRNNAADFALTRDDVETIDHSAFSGLIFTGTALAAQPSRDAVFRALDLARTAGLPVIFDVDYRPYSWSSRSVAAEVCLQACAMSDVIVGNDVEFGVIAGTDDEGLSMARGLVAAGAEIAIYKMGEAGAVTITRGGEFPTGVYRTKALKPTGAGDSFLGSFVAGLVDGRDLREAILRGSAAAAIVVAKVGCAPAMPTSSELNAFLSSQPTPIV